MLRAEINTGGHSVKKKKPYDRQVFRAITLIMQFGINMLVPICLMSAAGIWLDKHFGTDFWMILLFCMGAVAGGQNVYRMARTIYEDGDDKHTKKINRTVLEMDLGILFLGVSAQIIGAFIARMKQCMPKVCGLAFCWRWFPHIICTVPWTGHWTSPRRLLRK